MSATRIRRVDALAPRLSVIVLVFNESESIAPLHEELSGVLEGTIPVPVVEDLLAVLREALTNVARHASARSA
ncbi:MAG: hypothetical protein ACHQ7M_21350, partial [Chloroflexota bacterium]